MSLHLLETRRVLILSLAVALAGCGSSDSDGPPASQNGAMPDTSSYVPVTGVVKVNGAPIKTAVVTFLPDSGAPGVGETDENGAYSLKTSNVPGLPPGKYKVSVSYLVASNGNPQGLAPRGALAQSSEMLSAVEKLPQEYSELGRTKLTATVAAGGAAKFDFNIEANLDAKAPAEGEPKPAAADTKPAPEPTPVETKPAPEPAAPKTEPPAAAK